MPKRVITAAVGVAGLVVIGLGVASATVWRADDVLVATTDTTSHLIATDPGVLELGGDPVTIRATAAGGDKVVLAIGRDTDVAGWVGSDAHAQVTGLSGWHALATTAVAAGPGASASASPSSSASNKPSASASGSKKPTASPTSSPAATATGADDASAQPDPTGSDLWVAQAAGDGSAQLVWPAQSGRWSLLVAGTEDSPPTLSLAWPRVVTTPWLWPLVILGSLLVLAAAALLARDWNRRRTGADEPVWHPVTTGAMSTVSEAGAGLTRRQIREAELARSARPRTGSVPRVSTPPTGLPGATTSPGAPAPAAPAQPASPVPAATTRRALRTGAIPTVAPATRPTSPPSPGGEPPTETIPRLRRDGSAPAPSGAPATGTEHPDVAGPKPAWLRTRRSGDEPDGDPAATNPAATDPTATGAAPASPATPRRAPAGSSDAADVEATAVVPVVRAAPAAWVPTPPPASAPQTSAPAASPLAASGGPTAAPHSVTRPAWLPITHPAPAQGAPASAPAPDRATPTGSDGEPRPEEPATEPPGGSRADAWRRAWGLPSTDEPDTTEQGEDR